MILDMLISISLTSSVTGALGQNATVPRDGGVLGTGEATQESLLHLMGNTVSSTNSTLQGQFTSDVSHNHRTGLGGSSLG